MLTTDGRARISKNAASEAAGLLGIAQRGTKAETPTRKKGRGKKKNDVLAGGTAEEFSGINSRQGRSVGGTTGW